MKHVVLTLSLLFISQSLWAGPQWATSRPDAHAPIGVMGDHVHKQGEFMFSYRFMSMHMSENKVGTDNVTSAQVLNDFMVSPTKMNMDMHMIGGMYSPIDQFTLMFMAPLLDIEMDHVTQAGGSFTTSAKGLGDLKLTGLIPIWGNKNLHIHGNLGISLPTGSIDKKGNTPMGNGVQLPYPMQLGSGTYDILPGLTYHGQKDRWSWGVQANGVIRISDNDQNYTLGDQYEITNWFAANGGSWLSLSLRTAFRQWFDIDGADSRINAAVVPTADPNLRAGKRLDVFLGANFYIPGSALKGLRIATEFGLPAYQDLDGPQLETDWITNTGLQYTF